MSTAETEDTQSTKSSWEEVTRHPLKTVSPLQLEAAIARALQELAPKEGCEYRVSVENLNFGEGGLTGQAVKLSASIYNSAPLGSLFGEDLFGAAKPKA